MTESVPPSVVIRHEDLRIAAHAMLLRLPLRTPESRRIARVRELLDVSAELARLLAAQAHCGRVQSQGSHGTGDLIADTEAFYESLAVFGALVHEIATEYRRVADPADSVPLGMLSELPTAPARVLAAG